MSRAHILRWQLLHAKITGPSEPVIKNNTGRDLPCIARLTYQFYSICGMPPISTSCCNCSHRTKNRKCNQYAHCNRCSLPDSFNKSYVTRKTAAFPRKVKRQNTRRGRGVHFGLSTASAPSCEIFTVIVYHIVILFVNPRIGATDDFIF